MGSLKNHIVYSIIVGDKMNDALGDRMKGYENVSKNFLMRRTPVIIRVDGKAFHTYTRRYEEKNAADPFSNTLHAIMMDTARSLVSQIQNAVIAYRQSDEITILLKDWTNLNTDQWFGGNVQKMTSISAAMTSTYFNFHVGNVLAEHLDLKPAVVSQIPLFDSRVFNLPKEEVVNMFVWRQQDASRNSVNMFARHFFSHKELHGKSTSQVMDMLMLEKGKNWNDLETWKKRGSCVIVTDEGYKVDNEIPIFTQDRSYIERFL